MATRLSKLNFAVIMLAVAALCAPAMAGALDKVPTYTLPPGDVQGTLIESDGVTPHGNVKVTLKDATTGADVMSTMADAEGKYTLAGIAAGSYIVYIGNPGLGAVLKVQEGAKAGTLVIAVPKALSLPIPEDWSGGALFAGEASVVTLAVGGFLVCCVGGGTLWYEHERRRRSELRRQRNSPVGPMPTWELQLFYDQLWHGYSGPPIHPTGLTD